MAKIIKLENIVGTGYNRMTGKPSSKVTEEFVCENCRNLVKQEDTFCWHCGSPLEASAVVEHWHRGKKLTNKEFSKRKHSD